MILGAPGAGTSMLTRRLAAILPARRLAAARETTRIPRVAGLTSGHTAIVTTRLFRAPHRTISDVGVIGGGQRPMPGEVSLAHHGLLFLDALPELKRHVLEVLRQSLEKVSSTNHGAYIVDAVALAVLAKRVADCSLTVSGWY